MTSSMTTSTPSRRPVLLQRDRPSSTSVRRGGPNRSTVRGGRPSLRGRGDLGQLGDRLLDQRLAVAGGEVARRPPRCGTRSSPCVVEHDDALRDHRQRARRAGPRPSTPRRPAAARGRPPARPPRWPRPGPVPRGHDVVGQPAAGGQQAARRAASGRRTRGRGVVASDERPRRRQQEREHQPRLAAAGGAGVLGQPAGDHVLHPLADVHGVVADALVVAADQRELHGRLHVTHVGVELEDRLDVVVVELVEPVVHVVEGGGQVGVALGVGVDGEPVEADRSRRPSPAAARGARAATGLP